MVHVDDVGYFISQGHIGRRSAVIIFIFITDPPCLTAFLEVSTLVLIIGFMQ